MYSTQYRVSKTADEIDECKVCGKWLRSPCFTASRIAEGGMRIQGKYKNRNKDYPLVSIVTVAYNSEHTVERTIESVLQQDYTNVEYIIIDGGSQDNTQQILKKYGDDIDYYVSESDGGIYNAMNKGISLARGDYIGLLNSDDWFLEGVIRRSIDQIQEKNADFSCGDVQTVDTKGNRLYKYSVAFMDESAFFDLPSFNHQSMLISCKAYDKIGYYDEAYKIAADYDMMLRLLNAGFRGCKVDGTICYYELGGVSAEYQEASLRDMRDILLKYHPGITPDEAMEFAKIRWPYKCDLPKFSSALEKLFAGGSHIDRRYLIQWLLYGFGKKYSELSFTNEEEKE